MHERDSARLLVHPSGAPPVVGFGPFRFDLADGLLSRDGEELRLPPRALAILRHLVERPGRIVSKASLMDVAWKDAHVGEASLIEAVGLIRQLLGDDPQNPTYIQTVHRRGYRFVAPLATSPPAPTLAPTPADEKTSPSPDPSHGAPRTWGTAVAALLLVLLALAGVWAWVARRPGTAHRATRVNIAFPSEQAPAPGLNSHPVVALSPDGERFVYVGGPAGSARLFLRHMNRFDAVPLPGTEGGHGPFFSPDGQWVAFFARGSLKRVRVAGGEAGPPETLCAAQPGVGGAWVSAHEIVFAPNWRGPLLRVPASGGTASPLVAPPDGWTYRWPDRIDDDTILATRWRSTANDAAVVSVSLATGAEQVIAERAAFGRYVAGGQVLFLREGDLHAIRVGGSAYRPLGPAARVVPAVMAGSTGAAQFTVSPGGALLYLPDVPEREQRNVALVDDRGRTTDLPVSPRAFRFVSVCGDRLAATVFTHGQSDLWTGHLDRAVMTQVTREGSASEPLWSPDCRTISFSWNRTGVAQIQTVAIDSGEGPRVLFDSPFSSAPGSWSADGRWLAYTEQSPETSADIWLWDRVTGHRRPVVTQPGTDLLPVLSPDGKHVAYESGASGVFEIEVASVDTGARVQVSEGGGTWPVWSADGRQLFFLQESTLLRVDWAGSPAAASNPVALFSHPGIVLLRQAGDRFVWLRQAKSVAPLTHMNLVLDWFAPENSEIR